MYFFTTTLVILAFHGLILAMLIVMDKAMQNFFLIPHFGQLILLTRIYSNLKITLLIYGPIFLAIFVGIHSGKLDVIEYQNVGVLYLTFLVSVVALHLAVIFMVGSKTVYPNLVKLFIKFTMWWNIIAILYVGFVGFVIY